MHSGLIRESSSFLILQQAEEREKNTNADCGKKMFVRWFPLRLKANVVEDFFDTAVENSKEFSYKISMAR